MNAELEKLFNAYDFGYDLDLVSADEWNYSSNHYFRQIYLEDTSKSVSMPIQATFHVYMHDDGSIRELVVEKP